MNLPPKLKKGDTIAVISLSRGLIGEPFMAHQRELIAKRFQDFGLNFVYTPNALKGLDYLDKHPKKRAEDLLWAFENPEIDGIMCAIGGDDTYRTVPYLLDNPAFARAVAKHPKLFMGYSDTTVNHLTLHKLGLATYYGHSAIVDFGELDHEMLPYSKAWFEKLFENVKETAIEPSPVWYNERADFGPGNLGVPRQENAETRGFEVLAGGGSVTGKLWGGCLESLHALFWGRSGDEPAIAKAYGLFPSFEALQETVLFLETSESKTEPALMEKYLKNMDEAGLFEQVKAVLIGKPADETHYESYRQLFQDVIGKYNKPLLYNLNFGHAHPKCILRYGAEVTVDCEAKAIVMKDF